MLKDSDGEGKGHWGWWSQDFLLGGAQAACTIEQGLTGTTRFWADGQKAPTKQAAGRHFSYRLLIFDNYNNGLIAQ